MKLLAMHPKAGEEPPRLKPEVFIERSGPRVGVSLSWQTGPEGHMNMKLLRPGSTAPDKGSFQMP